MIGINYENGASRPQVRQSYRLGTQVRKSYRLGNSSTCAPIAKVKRPPANKVAPLDKDSALCSTKAKTIMPLAMLHGSYEEQGSKNQVQSSIPKRTHCGMRRLDWKRASKAIMELYPEVVSI